MSVASALVVAGIPFARTGRAELAAVARARLERGDEDGALALLLTDRDDWASGPGPTEADARAAIAAPTLREAMAALRFGPVADYFAYRWSDPTYLSGLALLDDHAGGCESALELACGIGHYLRELGARGIAATGVDVVFAKCWLARRFVAPEATLICADAASPLPDGPFDLAFCHDALHYLPEPARVCAELARVAPRVVVGHAHNALVDNLSAGAPLDPAGYAALLPGARLFDDGELTGSALREPSADAGGREMPSAGSDQTGRRDPALSPPASPSADGAPAYGASLTLSPPASPSADGAPAPGASLTLSPPRAPERSAEELAAAPAIAVVAGPTRPAAVPFTLPLPGAALRRNPLLGEDGRVRWPSERYAAEYGALSPHLTAAPAGVPGRATAGPDTDAPARARLLLDLPAAW